MLGSSKRYSRDVPPLDVTISGMRGAWTSTHQMLAHAKLAAESHTLEWGLCGRFLFSRLRYRSRWRSTRSYGLRILRHQRSASVWWAVECPDDE